MLISIVCARFGRDPRKCRVQVERHRKALYVLDEGIIDSLFCFHHGDHVNPSKCVECIVIPNGWKILTCFDHKWWIAEIRYLGGQPQYRFSTLHDETGEELKIGKWYSNPSAAIKDSLFKRKSKSTNGKLLIGVTYKPAQDYLRQNYRCNAQVDEFIDLWFGLQKVYIGERKEKEDEDLESILSIEEGDSDDILDFFLTS
jgi:hypothetical protein